MRAYEITPQDVLFFRDARPMETGGGSGGHGARWPMPSIFFSAVHAALHRAFPNGANHEQDKYAWEHCHHVKRNGAYDRAGARSHRFGSLQTAGPFPVCDGKWYFPAPADSCNAETVMCPACEFLGQNNLPNPLKYPVANQKPPSKERGAAWLDKQAFANYLGENSPGGSMKNNGDFFAGEWTTGIGIAPETQAQDKEHIYSAEYLRLLPQVCMGALAGMALKERVDEEGMDVLLREERIMIMGGQQRVCNVHVRDFAGLEEFMPLGSPITGNRVKWVLLAPAVFPQITEKTFAGQPVNPHQGGWLPSWINPQDGHVLLKKGETARRVNEGREVWRARVRQEQSCFDCRLVAACIPKPIAFSGWSDNVHKDGKPGARPTILAVPAGAVYYFEGADAALLAETLNWHGAQRRDIRTISNRRSALFGEQGFGLGVCANWKSYEDIAGSAGG